MRAQPGLYRIDHLARLTCLSRDYGVAARESGKDVRPGRQRLSARAGLSSPPARRSMVTPCGWAAQRASVAELRLVSRR